jgi:hypothetical protein
MDSSFYAAGTEIEYFGVGIDPEDGPLAADAFQWQIDFHHDTHKHDEPPIQGVVNGKFFIPDEGETSDNVWYTLILTVSDSKGRSDKDSVRILPRKSAIAVTTDPPGLEVLIDGQPVSTPVEIISVEGMKRSFAVESPQLAGGKEFEFESWSNDGDMAQTLATPADDLALTARFSIIVGTETKDFGKNVVLYPNPVNQNFFSIQFSVMQQQNVSIRLVNVMAQEVLATEQLVEPGEHDLQIDVSQAGPGIYYFMMDADGRRIAKKLIVASEN